ncbi:MAG: hypothetical protein ACUVSV_10655, partial [Armatimonadota bacterium]
NYASGTRCEFVVHAYTDTHAWGSTGQMASDSRLTTVYNKATLHGRNEWENDPSAPSAGVPVASFWLSTMNHNVSNTCVAYGWTKQMLLNDMDVCTAFYVNTHGEIGRFTSDWDEYSHIWEFVWPDDILPVRQSAVGSGYPPFNTGVPPMNVAFIEACLTGTDNSFSVLLWPYYNAYNHNWCENQAYVGWRIKTLVDGTRAANTGFWSALASGCTAHQARDALVYDYLAATGQQLAPGQHPTDLVSVWGDYYARIWGVYTATDSFSPNFWYW